MIALATAVALAFAPAPVPVPTVSVDTEPAPPPPTAGRAGALRGKVVDAVDYLPRQGVTLVLRCACSMEPIQISSGSDGSFAFEGLVPGRYQLQLWGGGGVVEYTYSVWPDQERELVLAVEPQRLPERDTRNLPVYRGYSANARLRAAQVELSFGGVLLAGGFVMTIGALVEGTKPACPHGPDTCGAPPRPPVARGLAIGAGLSTVVGGILLGLGLHHRHRYRLGLSSSHDGAGLTLSGSF